jgi:uncharacterized protein (UPF0276 family)
VHGVGFPVGGSRRPDPRHLPVLRSAIEELGSPWASEHLSFNEASEEGSRHVYSTSFLLPPLQTLAGAETAAAEIRAVARELPVPFAVETGVNYLRPRTGELADGRFVAEVVERADCGILLDLHNIWINERNGRQPVDELLEELPLERIWEIHLAGGLELDGFLIDAHSGEIPEELFDLARRVVPRLPGLRSLNFELVPDFFPHFGLQGVRAQLRRMWELWEIRGTRAGSTRLPPIRRRLPLRPVKGAPSVEAREWETALGRLVVGAKAGSPLEDELARDPGVALLQILVGQFRSGRIVSALPLTTRLLLLTEGGDRFRELLASFWRLNRPERFASVEAEDFAAFLTASGLDVDYLDEALALDLAALELQTGRTAQELVLPHDPAELVAALESGQVPAEISTGAFRVNIVAEVTAR